MTYSYILDILLGLEGSLFLWEFSFLLLLSFTYCIYRFFYDDDDYNISCSIYLYSGKKHF